MALMALNLLRFLAWQSPLMLPLALVGLVICRKRRGILVSLALGIALTLAVVLVVMPFQGHGWGYRYLHGLLGSIALLAAQGWIWLSDLAPICARTGHLFAQHRALDLRAATLAPGTSLCVCWPRRRPALPLPAPKRTWSSSMRAISGTVSISCATIRCYAPPKVLNLTSLRSDQIKQICGRYRVAIFDTNDAARRLALPLAVTSAAGKPRLRELMRSLGCAKEHVTAAHPPQS